LSGEIVEWRIQVTLPSFFVVGAMRSGTTSLFAALASHPEVFGAQEKELLFFDRHYQRGLDWYQSKFSGSENFTAVGEASQSYMYSQEAIRRMAATVPTARLIAILRDPVERAYSHYWLCRSLGRESLEFRDALKAEDVRINNGRALDRFDFSYVDRGRYLAQLQFICSHFDPSQLHVLLFDDLRGRPQQTFALVCRALGVDDEFRSTLVEHPLNAFQRFRSQKVRKLTKSLRHGGGLASEAARVLGALNRRRANYPPMPEDIRIHLGAMFRPQNEALGEWLNRDLSGWSGMCP
jgi:hypothetical protein